MTGVEPRCPGAVGRRYTIGFKATGVRKHFVQAISATEEFIAKAAGSLGPRHLRGRNFPEAGENRIIFKNAGKFRI